jgi:hypothetical protein
VWPSRLAQGPSRGALVKTGNLRQQALADARKWPRIGQAREKSSPLSPDVTTHFRDRNDV